MHCLPTAWKNVFTGILALIERSTADKIYLYKRPSKQAVKIACMVSELRSFFVTLSHLPHIAFLVATRSGLLTGIMTSLLVLRNSSKGPA